MKRIGIFGGSFDPIHNGHLIIADCLAERLKLDRVLFVPTAVTPHKKSRKLAPNKDRLAMIRAAVRSQPKFVACDLELRRGGVSYTIDTLQTLQKRHPKAQFFLLMGADSLPWLPLWREIHEIARRATLIIAQRPTQRKARLPIGLKVRRIGTPLLEISSTDIRQRVKRGQSIHYRVPEAVRRTIENRKLYRR